MDYRREIDGLRALAVVPVIFFHAGIQAFSGGFVGVDVFFVISGYLITTIILSEKQAGTFTILNFYERRARRILPALFFVMFACLPFAWIWLLPADMKTFSESLVAVSAFASNVLFWRTSGYFETAAELKPLLHTWSLAVEEQYYVFFPIFLLLTWRLGKRWIIVLLALAALISLAAAQWGSINKPTATFFLLPTRGWELLVGAFVAFYFDKQRKSDHSQFASQYFSLLGLALVVYAVFAFDKNTPFPSLYTLVPTIGAALIVLFATPQTFIGKLLGSKLFVGVGLISYSTYLWHQPLFAFARHRSLDEPSKLLLSALALASVALAYFSWKYVEAPFRNKHRFSRKQVFLFGALCSVFAVAIGSAGHFNQGWPGRYNISVETLLPTRSENLQLTDQCFLLNEDSDALDVRKCYTNASGKKYNVILLGDSHAASLYPGLKSFLENNDVNLGMMSAAYCLPLVTSFPPNTSQTATSRCERINRKIDEVLNSQHFDLVIVSSFILQWGFRNDSNWSYVGYYNDYLEKLKKLKTNNKILVVGQFPTWTKGLPEVVLKHAIKHGIDRIQGIPQYSSYGVDEKLFVVDQRIKDDLSLAGIQYVSVTDYLCKNSECMRYIPTSNGPKLTTFDYGHFGLEASNFISDGLVGPEILRAIKTQN